MLETQIREECNELLPFALVPSLCKQLHNRLMKELEIEEWNSAQSVLQRLLEDLEDDEQLSPDARNSIIKRITNLLSEQLQSSETLEDLHQVHHLSTLESQQLLSWINSCLFEIPERFHKLHQQLEENNDQLQEVETALERIPSDEILKPLMQKLSNLQQQLGKLQKQVKDEDANIQSLQYHRNEVERELGKLNELQQDRETDRQRAQLVTGVQSVLEMYSGQLTHVKVEALQNAVVDCFNQLCRKQGLVKRIEIDSQTFAVTLYDRQDRLIPKASLSAGEKQIYAISILWGLAKTSGRPLPMIIDTPLGRLDSDHRHHLIEEYFPHASHQVVVLSTDTELDKRNCEMLSPHVSHAYHLDYDQNKGSTSADKRYFWRIRDSER